MPKGKLAIALLVCIALFVLFLMLPKQPGSVRENSILKADPDSLKLAEAIAMANGPNGMQAALAFRDIVAKDSTNVEAHYWLGVLSVRSQQIDKAINRYEKVINLDSTYMKAYLDLGGIYMEQGDNEKALTYFNRSVRVDSTFVYGLVFKARCLELSDSLNEALSTYRQVLRHTNDTAIVKPVTEFISNINKKLIP
jgi:tetratricopeptide (TPR) repeat protein